MPKRKRGGIRANKKPPEGKRQLIFAEKGQCYGFVTKNLGDRRMLVKLCDGRELRCHIPGKMRKRVWINVDHCVLVSLREFQDDCADIIHRYDTEEVRVLVKLKQIPEEATDNLFAQGSGSGSGSDSGSEQSDHEIDIDDL